MRRSHSSIHCWHGHAARRSDLPRERFSPLALLRHADRPRRCPLLMLWAISPPAHECHGCGRCRCHRSYGPMSPIVKVCGCRPHAGGAARTGAGVRKPPMEETAGGVARWRVRRYGDLTAVVPECGYNFCDMARTLRMGENTFRHPCNFKELRVVKRAHITTCALCA